MIKVEIINKNAITDEIKKIQRDLAALPKEAHEEFVALTPIRSGNARRNTRLKGESIEADYPYAERLDEGWSKQAPSGMTQPFEQWLNKRLKSIFGK